MGKLILASASPRRSEILRSAGFPFDVFVSDADESLPQGLSCAEAVRLLAERKAAAVAERFPNDFVLGADTVVELDGLLLGKPKDEKEAAAMLRKLSGRVHAVHTGVCLLSPRGRLTDADRTLVEFYPLSEEEVEAYVRTGEPMDKAGAYGIQGRGALLVRRIDGDFYSVMALPVAKVGRMLREMNCYK